MKKFLSQSILLILVIGLALILFNPAKPGQTPKLPFLPQKPEFVSLQINDKSIKVEVADTQAKRSKGLAVRQSLAEDEGMLFIFDKVDKHPFWMKGLSFSLDFVWIKDEKIVDILENIPPPREGQKDSELPIYSAKEPINKVLELNAGTVKAMDIKIGDSIKQTPL